MSAPGPRTQFGPVPGYRNRQGETPGKRWNRWGRPPAVAQQGRTPGLMQINLRGNVLGVGQIRHMWRQTVNLVQAQGDISWSENGVTGQHPLRVVDVTRSLRYMTRSISVRSGEDNTRLSGLHTAIQPRVRSKPVTIGAGQVRSRPTVRNRMTSFGSRVPTINQPDNAAEPTQ